MLAEDKYQTVERTTAEQLVRSIYRFAFVQRRIAREAYAELGSQGFAALAVVRQHGSVRVGVIAHHLQVDLSVASRQVTALEREGYVAREPDPDDRRAQRISITDEGLAVLRESYRRMVDAFEDALAGWSEDEVDALAASLTRLRADFTGEAAEDLQEETTR